MAAILHPESLPISRPTRPALVLLDGGRSRSGPARAGNAARRASTHRDAHPEIRARLVPWLLVASALVGVWSLATAPGASVVHAPEAGVHVVSPGESLWSIAGGLGVRGDRRDVVDRLADVNGGYTVHVDQRLIIPSDLLGEE